VPDLRRLAVIPAWRRVQYESKENTGRKFWTARYSIRIDAKQPRLPMAQHLGGPLSSHGVAPTVPRLPPRGGIWLISRDGHDLCSDSVGGVVAWP
jgi:hypothetical protein